MYTNQAASLGDPRPVSLRCQHAPGEARLASCPYLRALERLRGWVERAEATHERGQSDRRMLGELWMLHAEIAFAFDHCPDAHHSVRVP